MQDIDTLAGRLDETRAGSGSARDRLRSAPGARCASDSATITSKNAAELARNKRPSVLQAIHSSTPENAIGECQRHPVGASRGAGVRAT